MMIRNICFYFPYRSIGGVSSLFLNVANELSDKFNIYIISIHEYYNRPTPVAIHYLPQS